MVVDTTQDTNNAEKNVDEAERPQVADREESLANFKSLMSDGEREYIVKNFEKAAEIFSTATTIAVTLFGDFAPESYDPHYWYGSALYELSLLNSENAVAEFGDLKDYVAKMAEDRVEAVKPNAELNDSRVGNADDVSEEERQEVHEAVEKAIEENAAELETLAEKAAQGEDEVEEGEINTEKAADAALAEAEPKPADAQPADATEAKEDAGTDGSADKADGTPAQPEDAEMEEAVDAEEEGEDAEADEDELDDSAIAWEVLEVARKICEKQEPTKDWDIKHAKVRGVLGRLSILDQQLDNAVVELEASRQLLLKHFSPTDRQISSLLIELAEAFKLNDDYAKAAEHYSEAKTSLSGRVAELEASLDGLVDAALADTKKEIEVIGGFIKDINLLLDDAQTSAKEKVAREAEKEREAVAEKEKEKTKSDDENVEPANDISASVRRKRPAEETTTEEADGEEVKKPKVAEETDAAGDAPATAVTENGGEPTPVEGGA